MLADGGSTPPGSTKFFFRSEPTRFKSPQLEPLKLRYSSDSENNADSARIKPRQLTSFKRTHFLHTKYTHRLHTNYTHFDSAKATHSLTCRGRCTKNAPFISTQLPCINCARARVFTKRQRFYIHFFDDTGKEPNWSTCQISPILVKAHYFYSSLRRPIDHSRLLFNFIKNRG